MVSAGLFASREGPCGLPAVCAARSRPTPQLGKASGSALPWLPGDGAQAPPGPFVKCAPYRRCLADAEIAAPSDQINGPLLAGTPRRPPEVRPTAFAARPPGLPPRYLMTLDFATHKRILRQRMAGRGREAGVGRRLRGLVRRINWHPKRWFPFRSNFILGGQAFGWNQRLVKRLFAALMLFKLGRIHAPS
jgi:hypothetical protein